MEIDTSRKRSRGVDEETEECSKWGRGMEKRDGNQALALLPMDGDNCLACNDGPLQEAELQWKCSCGGYVCINCQGANHCLRCHDY